MKWLDDKDSVSKEELEENKRAAYAAYADAAAEAYAEAAHAAYAAAEAADYWVDKYFKESGEDKNEYLKELNK